MTAQHSQPGHETGTCQTGELDTVLRRYIADPTASWGLGTFGAIAEFHCTAEEPVSLTPDTALQVITTRGALRINGTEDIRAFAYELPSPTGDSWHHALALCLPAVSPAMPCRSVLTECGPDHEALRPHDRTAVLFDLGLGTAYVDVCVRTAEPEVLAGLRTGLGRALFAPDNPLIQAMPRFSPHRVFLCRFARLEVYQRIPGPFSWPGVMPSTMVRYQNSALVPLKSAHTRARTTTCTRIC